MTLPVPLLIVDDRAANLAALEAVLDSPEYQLVMVQSAQEALLALLQTEFAAVLLDVKMPDMSGYELARLILGRKLNRHLPIIFVSSHRTDGTDVMLGYEAGAVDYITKPFDPTVLRSKVAVFAELYRQRHALAAEAAELRGQNARLQRILATRGSSGPSGPSTRN
jgi:DNA-binding response OmpR family regulator